MLIIDDTEILTLITKGTDPNKGYRMLVSKYKEKLYYHIRRMVSSHDDADDILQNTFLKVIRSIDGFQAQSSLYTWLYRIATNETLNFIKSSKNKSSESLDQTQVLRMGNSDLPTDGDIIIHKLNQAINLLPEKQKLVFNLRYYDEMSYQDMADVTETSVGALKASFHHAVKKIEEFIKDNHE
jgi:RNA polymerase sigma factor (sigma-70 family)